MWRRRALFALFRPAGSLSLCCRRLWIWSDRSEKLLQSVCMQHSDPEYSAGWNYSQRAAAAPSTAAGRTGAAAAPCSSRQCVGCQGQTGIRHRGSKPCWSPEEPADRCYALVWAEPYQSSPLGSPGSRCELICRCWPQTYG